MEEPGVIHLKTHPRFFEPVLMGTKSFEVRKNDRNFAMGDLLVLREWCPASEMYTGRWVTRTVTHVLRGAEAEKFGVVPGYCILSLTDLGSVLVGEGREELERTRARVAELEAALAASVPRDVAEHVAAACCAATNPAMAKFCRGLSRQESIGASFLATTEPSELRVVIRPVFDELLTLARAIAEAERVARNLSTELSPEERAYAKELRPREVRKASAMSAAALDSGADIEIVTEATRAKERGK